MKETGVIFSTPMVQADLEGRKTMTRRIIKPQPECINNEKFIPVQTFLDNLEKLMKKGLKHIVDGTGGHVFPECHYGKSGDLIYVRETWCLTQPFEPETYYFGYKCGIQPHSNLPASSKYDYSIADKWKPSIHMPKTAARIWKKIISVRPERLQDITQEDAIAEGVIKGEGLDSRIWYYDYEAHLYNINNPISSFKSLWRSIHGPDSWEANPWVWRIEYEIISTTGRPQNI